VEALQLLEIETSSFEFPVDVITNLNPREPVPDAVDAWLSRLAVRAQSGDRSARNTIFEVLRPRFAPIFWRIRMSPIWREREGRSWLFEDLEQEAFLVVCDLIEEWHGGENGFVGYLFSRLPWRLRDVLRTWAIPSKHESPSLPIGLHADDATDLVEIRVVLESVFERLPPELAEVLRMRVFGGLRDKEIAARLDVDVRTIRRRRIAAYRRARALYLGMDKRLSGFAMWLQRPEQALRPYYRP
jgi:RNA polymerase sigma factor (sigma-70 family)